MAPVAPVAPPVVVPEVVAPVVAAPVVTAPIVTPPVVTPPVAAQAPSADIYVTPLVRKLASDLGVDLAKVTGTGVGGRIRREDVQALATPAAVPVVETPTTVAPTAPVVETTPAPSVPAPTPTTKGAAPVIVESPLRGQKVKMTRLRKVIAARMVESLKVSAQLTTVVEVDVTKIARLRDRAKASFEAREGVKLSFMPFFSVAVCEALNNIQ